MDGYIKLHRKILDNPVVCKDAEYYAVWSYLLLNATHKDYPTMFKGSKITLSPGQLITGRKVISKQFNVSESKVQRILKNLEIEQQIEQQTSNENRLITILNWNDYQGSEQPVEQPVNNECTTDEQRVNTNKNVKNVRIKEIKNNIPENEFLESSFEIQVVNKIILSCKELYPNSKVPVTNIEKSKWATEIDKMIRLDKRSEEEINQALNYAIKDNFWKGNIRSTKKFREKFETLIVQSKKKGVTNDGNRYPNKQDSTGHKTESLTDIMLREGF